MLNAPPPTTPNRSRTLAPRPRRGAGPTLRLAAASTLLAAVATAATATTDRADAATPVIPRHVTDAPRIDQPVTAALPDGRALVGWVDGTNAGDSTAAIVRPAGGVLPSTHQTLRRGYASDEVLFLAGGPATDPVLTWFQAGPAGHPMQARLNGDRFDAQSEVLQGPATRGRFPRFVRCPDGTTAFSYLFTVTDGPSPTYAVHASLGDASGTLESNQSAYGPSVDQLQQPTVTCDRSGMALFSWADDPDYTGASKGEHLRVHQLGAGTQDPVLLDRQLAPGVQARSPEALVAPDGRVWIVWTEKVPGQSYTLAATRAPGASGAAAAPTVLDPKGETATLFFGAGGTTHLLVSHPEPGGTSYGVRTAPAGSDAFGPETPLVPAAKQFVRVLTDHPDGNPRLLISEYSAPNTPPSVSVQGIPAAGSTEPRTPLGFDASSTSASYLPSGDLFIVGSRAVGAGPTARYELIEGGLDTGAPPTLDGASAPGAAVPGEPVALAVDARDPLGLQSFTWTVDGRTYTETHATHTFTAPGTYVATARAVDRAGHATELTRTIRVLDPAAVSPGTPEFDAAVQGAGGAVTPVDRTAPTLTGVAAVRGRKGKAASTVAVRVTPGEAVAIDLELSGTLRRGGKTGRLVVRSGRVASAAAGRPAQTTLKAPTRLLKLAGDKLTVKLIATDAAGNRTQRTVKVTRR